MNKPHKHAELIKAWADGAEIQQRHLRNNLPTHWYDFAGDWDDDISEYRIKPEPKPDIKEFLYIVEDGTWKTSASLWKGFYSTKKPLLMLLWDGETGELKSAEVLK